MLILRVKPHFTMLPYQVNNQSNSECKVQDHWKIFFDILVGHNKFGNVLLKNNANLDAKNNESQTPLHYAVKYGKLWKMSSLKLFEINLYIILSFQ